MILMSLAKPKFSRTKFALPLAVLLALLVSGCGGMASPNEPVVFMAGFKPQANLPFVAAYVAQKKGYFADQGLDVEIRHASTGEHLQLLMSGDVDFTTADAASVLKRRADPGLPVVAFALFGQRGQQAVMALANSGMDSPRDWQGKTFGYKVSQPPEYLAILKSAGVERAQITEVRVGFDPRVLTEGSVDLLAVFKSNEPNVVRGLGFDVKVWDPADFGVPTLGLTYITREDVIQDENDKAARFLKATMMGLKYAVENRDEAVDIVIEFAPDENPAHQRFMLNTEIADAEGPIAAQRGMGWMADEQWKALYDYLIEFEALPQAADYKSAFTVEILEKIQD